MAVQIDASGDSVKKYGEELCGNRVEIIRSGAGVTAMLADGMGGGAKANILSSLAVKMMETMLGRGKSVEEIADMIVDSQPAGKEEGVSYSAFTLLQAAFGGTVSIVQMETPDVLLFRHGKPVPLETRRKIRQGRLIRIGTFPCREADTAVAFSRGVLSAGAEGAPGRGWNPETVAAFLSNAYRPGISAEKLVRLLLNAGSSLARQKQKDDLSAAAFRME